jgi:hypothetical protein
MGGEIYVGIRSDLPQRIETQLPAADHFLVTLFPIFEE